jgi:transcriptional regulator GlxA family with amidase domain
MYGRLVLHPAVQRLVAILGSNAPIPTTSRAAARMVGLSESHLHHLLRRQLNRSYLELVTETRVRRAHEMLMSSPQRNISEIADNAGYTTRTMCRHFRKVFGAPPAEIRRRSRRFERGSPATIRTEG